MREYQIGEKEAGQTLLKFLQKYLPLAPSSFFYKMLRKKNIKYNDQKADGKEKLKAGDCIKLYLSEDTIEGFQKKAIENDVKISEYENAYQQLKGIQVVYENDHVVILNKPFGILSQKAAERDLSLNEWLIGYLLADGSLSTKDLKTFHPSVCNRLDRNTCGLVLCSKTVTGGQLLSEWIRNRDIKKFYHLFVKGTGLAEKHLKGYLKKDPKSNRVSISTDPSAGDDIETHFIPLKEFQDKTYLEVELITGKTHQIRAHMASIGHPLLGDYKYGDRTFNDFYRQKLGIKSQMLCACRLEFPQQCGMLSDLNGKILRIEDPEIFGRIRQESSRERLP